MKRREFVSGTAASGALLSATSFGFCQAADAHAGEDLITLPDSKPQPRTFRASPILVSCVARCFIAS